MTATSDEAALCASIRANPDCDTVRLVYADWLTENGQEVLGELIRVQVELAQLNSDPAFAEDCEYPDCEHCTRRKSLRERESALAARLAAEWPGVLPRCPACRGQKGSPVPHRVNCEHCSGAGRVGSWVRGMLSVPVPALAAVWRRLRSYEQESENPVNEGDWVLTPWARDELLTRPWVCEVPILDREPDESVGHETGLFKGKITHDWNEETPQLNYAGSLPTFLFRALCDLFPDRVVLVRGARVFESDTPGAARTALARATAQAAFAEAGSRPGG